jgi:hypothetical protein
MARRLRLLMLDKGAQHPAANAHPTQVVNRFAEDRERRRRNTVRPVHQSLRLADAQLVVDPSVFRMEGVSERIVSRDTDILRTRYVTKVLLSPRVILDNRHR